MAIVGGAMDCEQPPKCRKMVLSLLTAGLLDGPASSRGALDRERERATE